MTIQNQQNQQEESAERATKDFLNILRAGEVRKEFIYLFVPGSLNIGANNTKPILARLMQLCPDGEVTVQRLVDATEWCYQRGQLFWNNPPTADQPEPVVQPEPTLTAQQEEAFLMVRELQKMREDRRRPSESKPSGPSLREKAEQFAKDESDWQSFKSEMATAQAINIIGYQGNISWGQTNDARRVAIEKCKSTWTKKHPEWAGRIEQYNSSVIQPVQQALPDNPTREQMNAVSPEVLRQWLKNQRHANRERLGEPSHDC